MELVPEAQARAPAGVAAVVARAPVVAVEDNFLLSSTTKKQGISPCFFASINRSLCTKVNGYIPDGFSQVTALFHRDKLSLFPRCFLI